MKFITSVLASAALLFPIISANDLYYPRFFAPDIQPPKAPGSNLNVVWAVDIFGVDRSLRANFTSSVKLGVLAPYQAGVPASIASEWELFLAASPNVTIPFYFYESGEAYGYPPHYVGWDSGSAQFVIPSDFPDIEDQVVVFWSDSVGSASGLVYSGQFQISSGAT